MAKCSQILKQLKNDGWFVDRPGKGSHVILKHPTKKGIIVFPNHGSQEMASGRLSSILKKAGLK